MAPRAGFPSYRKFLSILLVCSAALTSTARSAEKPDAVAALTATGFDQARWSAEIRSRLGAVTVEVEPGPTYRAFSVRGDMARSSATSSTGGTAEDPADAFLRNLAPLLGISDFDEEVERVATVEDRWGRKHTRFRQVFRGIPLERSELTVHVDQQGRVFYLAGAVPIPPPGWQASAAEALSKTTVDEKAAAGIAAADATTRASRAESPQRIESAKVLRMTPPYAVWNVDVVLEHGAGRWVYEVDAIAGTIVSVRDGIVHERGPVGRVGGAVASVKGEGKRTPIDSAVHSPRPLPPGVTNVHAVLPPASRKSTATSDSTHPKTAPSSSGPAAMTPNGTVTLLSESFEGAFPSGSWNVYDWDSTTNGEVYWDDTSRRAYGGSWSAWCASGGAWAAPSGGPYRPNMRSWMVWGPFSLTDAVGGALSFKTWLDSESGYDYLSYMVSIDGYNYYGLKTSGYTSGWSDRTLDFTNVYTLGNITGSSSVSIALVFESDGSTEYEGAYIDDVVVQKTTGAQAADLAFSYFYVPPGNYMQGDAITVSNDVTNTGGTTSTGYRISFYASTNTTISTSDRLLDYFDRDALAPGSTHMRDTTVYVPGDLAPGTYYVGAILTVSDADAGNNSAYYSTPITVVRAVDGPSIGTGYGVLGQYRSHIDSYFDTAWINEYKLDDVTRRSATDPHGHGGAMPSNQSIRTYWPDGSSWEFAHDYNNVWEAASDASAVDAHVFTGQTYDYLWRSLGLNGFDDAGASMSTYVDYPCGEDNAGWTGAEMIVCSPVLHPALSGAMDVIAHEWGHAVTERAAVGRSGSLIYERESGALNEAFSDWMGVATEFYYGETNWTMGEGEGGTDIWTLRSLSNPPSYGQPDRYQGSGWVYPSPVCEADLNDNCGVHTNSGVGNKMFYLLAVGGTFGGVTVTGIGRQTAMEVALDANRYYWSATATYAIAREGMVAAAEAWGQSTVTQVMNAWSAVGVGPVNDACSAAKTITNLPYSDTISTVGATGTGDVDVPCGNGSRANGVWYVYTPSGSGTLVVDTVGSDYDTLLTVFRGSCSTLTSIGCDDDAVGNQSRVAFDASGGTTYYFYASAYQSGGGSLHINVSPPPSVTVTAPDSSAGEPSNGGSFRVSRTGSTTQALSVAFGLTGTASASDFSLPSSTNVSIPAGQSYVDLALTVTDDAEYEPGETVTLTIQAGGSYIVGSPSAATITISSDDPAPVVTLSANDQSASEPLNRGQFTFTRTGSTTAPLSVYYTITGTAGLGVDYESIASPFVIGAGSSQGTLDITVIDDSLAEGVETVILNLSANASYQLGATTGGTVQIADDDVPGVQVSPTSGLATTEAGGTAQFTVRLLTRPSANVTIGVSSSDLTEGTVLPTSLTFTSSNWASTQTVTVTGVDDWIDDGAVAYTIVTAAATSSDSGYNGLNPSDASASNADDDSAGFTFSQTTGLTTTEAGGTAPFTVRLNSQPLANVSVSLTSSDTTEGTVAPSSLTFTSSNWNNPQTVTVTGVDDSLDDGSVAYTVVTSASSSDPGYGALNPPDVSVTNSDNDTAGITLSQTTLSTSEPGGSATFTMRLDTQPSASVAVGLSSSDTTEGTVSPASLTFTSANWNVPQTVSVTAVDDSVVDGPVVYSIVTGQATSTDPAYSVINPADVSVTNGDNDVAGFTVVPTSGLSTSEAGTTAQFTVRLTSQPSSNVTIGLSSNDLTEGSVAPASLTFTSANWAAVQTVTLTGVDDSLLDGPVAWTAVTSAASSSDPNYNGVNPSDVQVTNTDNDQAGFAFSATTGLTTTESGGTAAFTVRLTSTPASAVSMALSSSDTTEGTVSPVSITFDAGNWSVPQTVTVTGVDDSLADGAIAYTVVTAPAVSSDVSYSNLDPPDVAVSNSDNEVPGFTVTPVSGLRTSETGTTATFTVRLNTQPSAGVTVGISSGDATEGSVTPTALTFTSANWNAVQTVSVTGVNDDVVDGGITYLVVTAAAASADASYNGLAVPDVQVTNDDDDVAGFTLVPASGLATSESGGTAQFTVRLNSKPSSNVTLGLTSGDSSEGTVAPSSLVFTTANWNVPQTVTVTGVDDAVLDGDVAYTVVTAAAVSSDSLYSGLNPPDVTVTNSDDDVPGFTVSPESGLITTEAGGTAQFSIVLRVAPSSDVTIGLTSSDATEGTVAPSSITFTPGNWNVARVVTVTGVDDSLKDGAAGYQVVTAPAVSVDSAYNGLNPPDVSVTNSDNEADVTLTLASASLCAEQTTVVPITVTSTVALKAVQFELIYDPAKVTVSTVQAGALLAGFSFEVNVDTPGLVRVAAASGSPAAASSGEIAKVTFVGAAGMAQGTSSAIAFANVLVDDLPPTVSSGALSCPIGLLGDVNRNGSVTAFDASLILQSVVGSITFDSGQLWAADFNKNGSVTAFDASLVLQCVVGTGPCQ